MHAVAFLHWIVEKASFFIIIHSASTFRIQVFLAVIDLIFKKSVVYMSVFLKPDCV